MCVQGHSCWQDPAPFSYKTVFPISVLAANWASLSVPKDHSHLSPCGFLPLQAINRASNPSPAFNLWLSFCNQHQKSMLLKSNMKSQTHLNNFLILRSMVAYSIGWYRLSMKIKSIRVHKFLQDVYTRGVNILDTVLEFCLLYSSCLLLLTSYLTTLIVGPDILMLTYLHLASWLHPLRCYWYLPLTLSTMSVNRTFSWLPLCHIIAQCAWSNLSLSPSTQENRLLQEESWVIDQGCVVGMVLVGHLIKIFFGPYIEEKK